MYLCALAKWVVDLIDIELPLLIRSFAPYCVFFRCAPFLSNSILLRSSLSSHHQLFARKDVKWIYDLFMCGMIRPSFVLYLSFVYRLYIKRINQSACNHRLIRKKFMGWKGMKAHSSHPDPWNINIVWYLFIYWICMLLYIAKLWSPNIHPSTIYENCHCLYNEQQFAECFQFHGDRAW